MAGPILASKGMHVIYQKKGKIFENLGKIVQHMKYCEKGQVIACNNSMQ